MIMNTFQFTRTWFIRAVLGALIVVTVLGWIFTCYLVDVAKRTVKTNVDDANLIISLHLINELKRIENAAVAVAGSPLTLPLLQARTSANYEKANNILDRYHKSLEAAACYLIDSSGLTRASSNRTAKDSFVGQNYTFRPYFQQAMKGGLGRYFAVGTVSERRGFYASAPVKNKEGRIVGVMVIKKELDDIESKLKQYTWFLVDRSGIIFLSSQPEARLKSLWPLTEEQMRQIVHSKQYGKGPFEPVLQKAFTAGEEVTFKGKQYVTAQDSSSFEGISVVLLWSTKEIGTYRSFGIILTLLTNLLILSFLTVIYIFQRSNSKMKELLETLSQTEERGRLILASINEGIFGLDKEGITTFVNPAATAMLGYTAEELVDHEMHAKLHHAYPDGAPFPLEECPIHHSGQDGMARAVDSEVLWKKDGTALQVEYSTTPILKDGEVVGTVVSFRDITERKKADAMKVEKEVAEEAAVRAEQARREAELAQEELKAKMLEIERFSRLSLGREERIIELKRQVNELALKTGGKPFYQEQDLTGDAGNDLVRAESKESDFAQADVSPDVMAEMLAVDRFKRLLEDFCDSVGIASAIIDLKGKVLAAARWQRACTDFHRVNETTCARCIESDTELALNLSEGKPFSVYRCKNGLTDAASPIIVNGRHIANTFVGQFFTVPPDMEFFKRQAVECGLEEEHYLEAIREVPIVPEEKLKPILGFLVGVSQTVATMSMERDLARKAELANAGRIEESKRERAAAMSLAEDANNARAEVERYRDRLELLVLERTDELRSSEERSRLILASISEGIFGLDTDGVTTFVNPAAVAMLGYTAEELVGHQMHAKVHHAYPDGTLFPREKCPMHHSTRDGTARTVDDQVLWKKDGTALQVEYSTTPIFKDGCVKGTVVSFRDITERKRMETQIRREREKLQDIMDSSPIAVAISSEGKFVFANPTFKKMFDVQLGDPAVRIYQRPEDRLPIVEGLQKDGIVSNYEIQLRGAGDRPVDILVTFLQTTYDGRPGILGWLVDITERKKAEEAILEAKNRTDAILEASTNAIVTINEKGAIETFNPAAEKIFGYDALGISGQSINLLMPEEHAEKHDSYIDHYLKTGVKKVIGKRLEVTAKRKNGEIFPIEISISEVFLKDTKLFTAIISDITERKKAEEELAQRMDELERFTKLTVDRELKMIELKEEINNLAMEMGKDKRYKIVE
jgi:PAS domain S-box-containing protein